MKMFLIPVCLLLLAGCGGSPTKEIITVEKIIFPDLPDVPAVPPLELLPCTPDRPRVWWEPKVIKSNSVCKSKLEEDPKLVTNPRFQDDCMEYPIDVNSNIIIGFDKDNQQCYILNREKIRYQLKKYQDRIDQVNEQRREWRARNQSSSGPN
jgi:hypothetical protein